MRLVDCCRDSTNIDSASATRGWPGYLIGRCFPWNNPSRRTKRGLRWHSCSPVPTSLVLYPFTCLNVDLSSTTMSREPLNFRVPDIKFRVLVVGRANAGKTTILQRVCETTESPKIYRTSGDRREEVGTDYLVLSVFVSSFCQIHLDPTTEVSQWPMIATAMCDCP